MPGAVRPISRRRVLIAAAALSAIGATASDCGSPAPPQPEELEPQLDLARRDSQMASAAATAAGPFYAPLLNVVAGERAAHAKALSQEIARAAAETTTSSQAAAPTTSSQAAAPTTSGSAAPPPSRTDVMAALRESADSAAKLAANLSGYRAGLLGSIAASCTASVTVPLAMTEQTR
jgi:hypothetical protein